MVRIAPASNGKNNEIQITSTNLQSTPLVITALGDTTIVSFTVTAAPKVHDEDTLRLGSLWIYDGPKYISSCLVEHGKSTERGITFTFQVTHDYLATSRFYVRYGTTNTFTRTYWFYLKDFVHSKSAA
jgi:hypothetical protein